MKVKCRGFEGELVYLTVSSVLRNVAREPVRIYSIDIQIDKNNLMSMHNVKDGEIEVVK